MSNENYWERWRERKLTRRTALGGAVVGAAGLAGLTVIGCGGGSSSSSTPTQGASTGTSSPSASVSSTAAATKQGAKVRVGLGSEPQHLDPMQTVGGVDGFYTLQLFNPLYEWVNNKWTPSLAKSYEVTPDGLQFTFHLADGVKFHNGDDFTSADCMYTYQVVTKPGSTASNRILFTSVDSVSAPDPSTFVYKMKQPDAGFLLGGFGGLLMLPHAYYDKVGADGFNNNPVGTGPYQFKSRTVGQGATFTANPSYFQGQAPFQQADYKVLSDDAARVNSLQAQEVDVITAIAPELVPSVKGQSGTKVIIQRDDTDTFFNFPLIPMASAPNPTWQLFQDQRVRQALNYAIDRNGIASKVYGNGLADPYSVTCPDQPFDIKKTYPYDLSKAKQLLSQAGANGMKLTLYGLVPGRLPGLASFQTSIASNLRDAGIDVKEQIEDYNVWIQRLRVASSSEHIPDGMIIDWAGTAGGTDPFSNALLKWIGKGPYSYWSDSKFDDMLNKARTTIDTNARNQAVMDMFNYMYDQAPGLWAVLLQEAYGFRTSVVADWRPRTLNNPVLHLVDLVPAG